MTLSRSSVLTACAVIWTVLILVACWLPARHLPVPEAGPPPLQIPHLDKIIHFTLFAGLGLLWMLATGARHPMAVAASGVAFAIVSELGQAMEFVHREPEWADGLADAAGLLVAVILLAMKGLAKARRAAIPASQAGPSV